MARTKDRNGFTLVELLVVIGIIALLIAVLLPALSAARKAAQAAVCMSNMRQWGMAIQMYTDQNKGILPQKGPSGVSSSPFNPTNNVTGWDDTSLWFNALPPFMNQTPYSEMVLKWATSGGPPPPHVGGPASIWICPSSLGPAPSPPQATTKDLPFAGGSPFPSQSEPDYYTLYGIASSANLSANGKVKTTYFPFFSSYLINSKLTQIYVNGVGNATPITKLNMSKLQPSSEVVTMVESLAMDSEDTDPVVQQWYNTAPGYATQNAGTNYFIQSWGYNSNVAQSGADWTRFTCRHNHGGHLLFADGHVAHFGWPEVQIPYDQQPTNHNLWDWNQYGKIRWSTLGPVQ